MAGIGPSVVREVLSASGGSLSRLRLMNLLFLARMESPLGMTPGYYDFLPYRFGPYSFIADRDIGSLETEGLLIGSEKKVRLADGTVSWPVGRGKGLPEAVREKIRRLASSYKRMKDSDLTGKVYAQYPSYTVLSEGRRRHPPRPVAEPAVYTLGFQGASADRFLRALIEYGIQRVLDVRNHPVSRVYGFAGSRLASLCSLIGVDYVHLPELGIPSAVRQDLTDLASYQKLFDYYEKTILPAQADGVKRASRLIREKVTAMVCLEADPSWCHRGRLAVHVSRETGLSIRHLKI